MIESILMGLGIVIPPLIYVFIIYLTSPINSITIGNGVKYLFGGVSSIFIVNLIFLMFPSLISHNDVFINTFLLIAPREEISKMLLFLLITLFIPKKEIDNPVSIMLYCGMVGLGFAMFENIQYVSSYKFKYGNEVANFVMLMRTLTSTIGHMLFGMFMGYWLALGNLKESRFRKRSVFSSIMANRPKLKKVIYGIISILSASIYHGLWNYNLMVGGSYANFSKSPIMIFLLIFGLFGAKVAMNDLDNLYRNRIK